MKKLFSALLCSSMLLGGAGLPVAAQEEMIPMPESAAIVHSGKIGTADWTIDSDGTLTIGPGEFTNDNTYYNWPWREFLLNEVTRVDGTAAFKINGNLRYIFNTGYNVNYIESIDVSGWDTSSATDMSLMFGGCFGLTSLNLSGLDTSSVTNMANMFDGCNNLTSLDLSGFDTSKVTKMENMFKNCYSLTSLDLSSFDTSKVTSMREMFRDCRSLTSLDLSNFDTSMVFGMYGIFENCSSLTSLDLSSFDTSWVTDMSYMFSGCSSLTSLDLSSFDTSNVHGISGAMSSMFENCSSLTSLDLSNFDTSGVTSMSWMFSGCSNLTSLDISRFDVSKVTNEVFMFSGCSSIAEVRYSETARRILAELPEQTGWYQYDDGPYSVPDLPEVPVGQTTLLNRTGIQNPNPPQKEDLSTAEISALNASYEETGSAITPKPKVEVNGKVLAEGTDYTLSYTDNQDPGTAMITITGIGNYQGTKTVYFTITKKPEQPVQKTDLSEASVTDVSASYEETGSAITPRPRVELNGKVLAEGTDYTLSYTDNQNPGTATITITGIGNYQGTAVVNFTITEKEKPGEEKPPVETLIMHRLYNPNSGEHFYTAETKEKDYLDSIGWKYEGEGWKAPVTSQSPVYRLYNENAGDHHYTTSEKERDFLKSVGWKDEGIGWYSDDSESVPLYRQYNPNAKAGSHNYTTDKNENDYLVKNGWKEEGIGWFGIK